MTLPNGSKTGKATAFLFVFCALAFTAKSARADLSVKQARKLITQMAGFKLTNGSVRVKTISPVGPSTTEVRAEVRTVFKFEKDKQGSWRVAEVRTGQDRWEQIDFIANSLKTDVPINVCTAPDPPFKGSSLIDPSVKRARCLLGSLLGIEVPSDALRIQAVAPLAIPLAPQPSATVVAWIKVDALLENSNTGWQVGALRTGTHDWISLAPIVAAVNGAKQTKARAELETIAKALEKFRDARGFYVVSDKHAVVIDHLNPRYLAQVIRVDPWQQPYKYQGEHDHFTLSSDGPDGKEDTADDIKLSGPSR
jgi:hypothetical protein